MIDYEIYCPICARVLTAANKDEVESGGHNSYVFVHDDVPHEESDIEALGNNIN